MRQRHGLPRGDLDRVVRQQYFLSVEAHKFLSAGTLLNPGKLSSVLDAVSGSLETDPGLNFLSLAAQLQGLTGGKLQSATIPISGTPTITVDGNDLSIVAGRHGRDARLHPEPDGDAERLRHRDGGEALRHHGDGAERRQRERRGRTTATKTFASAGFKTGDTGGRGHPCDDSDPVPVGFGGAGESRGRATSPERRCRRPAR